MTSVLPPSLSGRMNGFPPSPTLSASYPDLVVLKAGVPYAEDTHSKQSFVHAEYDTVFTPSIPSTAPSSPLYSHSMGSRDSYFSTPSYSSVDPNEELDYDEEEDEAAFPSFENNTPQLRGEHSQHIHLLNNGSSDSITTAGPPPDRQKRKTEEDAKDDLSVAHEPTRHVDYLSHEWEEQDIWSSWRYVNARRRKNEIVEQAATNERLENAAWRTWTKTKNRLRTISPESLNWMKDCDVTWLYGPLQVDTRKSLLGSRSPPTSQLSTCSSFLHKKPILKKKSASAALLERSLSEHNLLSRVGDIIRVQQSSPAPKRPGLGRAGSDFSLPSYHTTSALNTPADTSLGSEATTRHSFGAETPIESKHVLFNEEVRQVQAIESEDDEKDEPLEEDFSESDEDDDGGLMMAPPRSRSNRSTPRSSFSENNKTIAPLPPTTLKYRKDTPEPPPIPITASLWQPARRLQHTSSQETLKPTNANHNFLLDDDPELNDDPWPQQNPEDGYYSMYTREGVSEPNGMRRTASGMFMPYDENEEEAAMNNTLFGQAVYAVNTFRDIAHVVWNVGWNRAR